MSATWESPEPQQLPSVKTYQWPVVFLRAALLIVLVFGGLLVLLAVRMIERPICGVKRPVTPHITQFVCRNALRLLGIGYSVSGTPITGRGAIVANHTSWMDIFTLNAAQRVYFVSKSEVANWPGIGWLARATGTVFLERKRAQARKHTQVFEERLLAGHKLLFFPEGTSTDGMQVLPFKTTLFQPFLSDELRDMLVLQPVSVVYHAPKGADRRHYCWWGDTAFAPHLLVTLASWRQGRVDVIYHPPLAVADYQDRKALARACEGAVRSGYSAANNVDYSA
ncbi:MAG: lysophospholipid acyltransferase family protein [Sulfitobacter sp.]